MSQSDEPILEDAIEQIQQTGTITTSGDAYVQVRKNPTVSHYYDRDFVYCSAPTTSWSYTGDQLTPQGD